MALKEHLNNYDLLSLLEIDEFGSIVFRNVEQHVRKAESEGDADAESEDKVFCQLRT